MVCYVLVFLHPSVSLPSCPEIDALLLMDQPHKSKHLKALGSADNKSQKAMPRGPPASEQGIINLVVGTDCEQSPERASQSSGEEGVDLMESDISMDESDYPLRDGSLLQQLLYSGEAVGGLTDKRSGEGLQMENVSPIVRPGEDESCPPLPSRAETDESVPVTGSGPPAQPSTAPDPTSKPLHVPSTASLTQGSSAAASTGTTDDWSSVSSLFGLKDRSLESAIVQAVGMEKLTRLGRVTSARVVVESLQLDPAALETIHSLQRRKKSRRVEVSRVPWSAVSALGRYRVDRCK